jgi:hypothetical protein
MEDFDTEDYAYADAVYSRRDQARREIKILEQFLAAGPDAMSAVIARQDIAKLRLELGENA